MILCEHVHEEHKHTQLSVAFGQNRVLQDGRLGVAWPAVEILVIPVCVVLLQLAVAASATSHLSQDFHVNQQLNS